MRRLVFLACLGAGPIGAQSTETLDRRIARLDSLIGVRLAELPTLRERERDSAQRVAIEVRGFRFRVPREFEPLLRTGAESAWSAVIGRGGTWVERELPRRTIDVYLTDGRNFLGVREGRLRIDDGTASAEIWPLEPEQVRRALVYLADQRIDAQLEQVRPASADSIGWREVAYAPKVRRAPDETFAQVALRLRTHPARSNRACIAGDPAACLLTLGLLTSPDADPSTWHDPGDYFWIVAGMPRPREEESATARARCLEHELTACERYLHLTKSTQAFDPADPIARATFLWTALELGGHDALDRFLAAPGPIGSRLEAAAGQPLAAIAVRWQQRVASISQPSLVLPLLVCALLVAVLAITPSRRTFR